MPSSWETDVVDADFEDDDYVAPRPTKRRKRSAMTSAASTASSSMASASTTTPALQRSTKNAAAKATEGRRKNEFPPASTPVHLNIVRDELLPLSSAQFDAWSNKLRDTRNLTNHEENELRNIRRRIRNRESARESRSNKRNHTSNLEQYLQEVKEESCKLETEISALETEKLMLMNEAMYLTTMIHQHPALSKVFNALFDNNNMPASASSVAQPLIAPPSMQASFMPLTASSGSIGDSRSMMEVTQPEVLDMADPYPFSIA